MIVYRIANWEFLFETYETKKLTHLKWVPVPNKHDGLGYRRVAAQKNRCELFAAWNLILQVASKGRKTAERGMLQRDGKPLTPDDLAIMTGFPASIFETAITFFSSPEMGWLVVCAEDATDKTAEPPAKTADGRIETGLLPAEGKGREGIEGKDISPPPDKFSKARIVLFWLNEKAGRHYRETSENLSLIHARLSEVGGDIEGAKLMVSRMVELWKGGDMDQFLRPETLFGKKKFGGYYDERNLPVLGLKKVGLPPATRSVRRNESDFLPQNLPNSPI